MDIKFHFKDEVTKSCLFMQEEANKLKKYRNRSIYLSVKCQQKIIGEFLLTESIHHTKC